MRSIGIISRVKNIANSLLGCVLFGLVMVPCDCYALEARSLFSVLPEQTSVAVLVNDFPQAVATTADTNQENNSEWWGDFSDKFGIPPQELASSTTGSLLRAEIYVDGSWDEIVVASISPQGVKPLLDSYYKEHGRIAETIEFGTVFRMGNEETTKTIVHSVYGDYLVLATSTAAAEKVAERLKEEDSRIMLAGWEPLALETDLSSPNALKLTWYAAPWLKHQIFVEQDEENKPSKRLNDAQRHGLIGIVSLGGTVLYENNLPVEAQTTVHAPRPWSNTLKIFESLRPQQGFSLPDWVPEDVEQVEVASIELPQAFENIDALFDDFYAEGIEGTYRELLEDFLLGLNLDLQNDVYAQMGQRLCLLHTLTNDAAQERVLYSFETKSPQTAAAAVRRMMEDDPEAKQVRIEGYEEPMWLVPAEEPGGEDFLFMVAKDCIFFSNDVTLMRRVLKPDVAKTLAQDKEAREIFETILESANQPPSFFAVRGKGNSTIPAGEDRSEPPLKILFDGPDSLEVWSGDESGDILSTIFPVGEDFRVSVGFSEENGWRIDSRSLPGEGQDGSKNSGD